ncbi:MAG: nucleotidyltransferase domain-containing protein [Anaerolineae bacterium]|nr:nucleotidyltransferase domain-containing protein [Anaerolineae bacterium]MDW8299008.1 nucleotidyltransferase domain-containing protein [Anaerolineae bacterium]
MGRSAPTLTALRSLRTEILIIAARHGASNVRVFGSVARGQATEESDVDLLVDQDWSRLSAWGGVGLALELEALLGWRVDVITPEELKPCIRERILRESVPL